jgi:glycine cleavage system H protein
MSIKYSSDHEWVRLDGDIAAVGISNYAQEQLGDVVFVELPKAGTAYTAGDELAVVESVKAASEIYAPVGGEITEVNDALTDEPGAINTDPLGEGWIFKLRIADSGEVDALMDEDAYTAFVESLE